MSLFGSLMRRSLQVKSPIWDPGWPKCGSPVDAVGIYTTDQTNTTGMHRSKLRVTVECEEDQYDTNLNRQ